MQISGNSGYLPWTLDIQSQKKGHVRQRPIGALCGAHLLPRGHNAIALDRVELTRRSPEAKIFDR